MRAPAFRGRPIPYTAVGLTGGLGLAYEVLLLRLFAVAESHHFAYLAISLALLGFGVAGTLLTLAGGKLVDRERAAFAIAALGFAITAPSGWALAQRLPLIPMAIYWDPLQWLWLGCQYLLLIPPFLFIGAAVCIALQAAPARATHTYGADLAGAGLGAATLVALLFWLDPAASLRLIAVLGAVAAFLVGRRGLRVTAVMTALAIATVPAAWLAPQPNQYKQISQQLNAPGAEVIDRRHGPLGLLELVRSPQVPIRHAPGMSMASPHAPPAQLALFTDGAGKTAVLEDADEAPAYLDWLTSALPYALLDRPATLILGLGGGTDVWQAKYHQARAVDAVEVNPDSAALIRQYGGEVLAGTDLHIADARAFVRRTDDRFDLIQMAYLGAPTGATAGVGSLREAYSHTREAYADYLDRLRPDGLLAVTYAINLPPRATIKALATAIDALEGRGVREPGQHLALVRGWKSATLLVKLTPLTAEDIQAVRRFADKRSFDLAHLPGLAADEVNRHNRLDQPWFHEAAEALLGDGREDFFRRYPFHVNPATDDQPYFFHFFKWRQLSSLVEQRSRGALGQVETGYPLIWAALLQAGTIAGLLILAPMTVRAGALRQTRAGRARLLTLCLAVGLGFMFVEIAFIQRFMLILGHQVYAVAVVLAGFLIFAGVGSVLASRLGDSINRPVAGIAILSGIYLTLLPAASPTLVAQPVPIRVAACLTLIAPLATCMGMPYARALRRLGQRDPALLPWTWAINGFASVVAVILATLLGVHLGFTLLVAIAVGLYAIAAIGYRF